MDTLLAGTLSLPWRVHCAGVVSSAAPPVKTIPGCYEKPFAFPPESLFTFSPESCSPSLRNAFHVHPGTAFTLPRNPYLTSKSRQRTYKHAITEFVDWYFSEPRLAFNRTVVLRYRIYLEQRLLAPTTINLRLASGPTGCL